MKKSLFLMALLSVGLCSCNDSVKDGNGQHKNKCGNGVLEYGEVCDGSTDASCYSFDASKDWQPGGIPGCSDACTLTQGSCAESSIITTCGNGKLDAGEACDGTQFANPSQTCASIMGAGATGTLRCNACRISTANCIASSLCGNGQIDPGERCDGTNFDGKSCATFAGEGATGSLSCIGCATIDATNCIPSASECGNNRIDPGEACDGDDIGDVTCNDLIIGGDYIGTPRCNETCSGFYVTGCVPNHGEGCGNYRIDEGELCDMTNVGDATCESVMGAGYTGALICAENCQSYITTECVPPSIITCGNGQIDANEDCDSPTILGGATCESVMGDGYTGTLSCTRGCRFDTSDCKSSVGPSCSNGIREGNEECDGSDMPIKTCVELLGTGYTGYLSCAFDCTFDTSDCSNSLCGNGVLDGSEECDGNAFVPGSQPNCPPGTVAGDLVCSDSCTIDNEASCVNASQTCNNNVLDEGEYCDPSIDTFTPRACAYAPDILDGFVRDFFYIRPSDASYGEVDKYVQNANANIMYIPWSFACTHNCKPDMICQKVGNTESISEIYTDTLISKLTTSGGVDEKKLKAAGFSWNLNAELSVDTDYTYVFGAWRAGESGMPNLQWYVAYDLTKASASIPTDFNDEASFISVAFYVVKKQANSIDTITVMLYDGDLPVGKIADVKVGAHGNHWQNSGELVFSIKGLANPAIRFVSAKSGAAIKIKNLHVTGIHMMVYDD